MLPLEGRLPVIWQTFDMAEKDAKGGAHPAAGQVNVERPPHGAVKLCSPDHLLRGRIAFLTWNDPEK